MEPQIPILPNFHLTVADYEIVPRGKFAFNVRIGEHGLDFGSKDNALAGSRVIEGLDPDSVSGQKKTPLVLIPKRECEHSVYFFQARRTEFLVQVHNDFGVALRL